MGDFIIERMQSQQHGDTFDHREKIVDYFEKICDNSKFDGQSAELPNKSAMSNKKRITVKIVRFWIRFQFRKAVLRSVHTM